MRASLFVIVWSSAFIAGIVGVGAGSPLLLTFVRFAAAGVLLGSFALAVRAPWPKGKQLAHVMVAGVLIQAVQFSAFYTAMSLHMPAAVVALVQGLNPVVIALVAERWLGERVTPRQWAGFGLGAVGGGMAVAGRVSLAPATIVLSVVGLLAVSLGTVYQKRFAGDMDVRTGTATQFLVSAPLVGLAALTLEKPHVSDPRGFALAAGWLVLVNSIGAFLLLNTMLRNAPASRVSTLFFLTPAVTAVMAWVVVGQRLDALTLAGLVVGAAGVLLASGRVRGFRRGSAAVPPGSSPGRTSPDALARRT
ncbi:MAG: DMT family transporter [Nonomuraea sp.]|nr:DMT family transporter [Nonomuraea sp.]